MKIKSETKIFQHILSPTTTMAGTKREDQFGANDINGPNTQQKANENYGTNNREDQFGANNINGPDTNRMQMNTTNSTENGHAKSSTDNS